MRRSISHPRHGFLRRHSFVQPGQPSHAPVLQQVLSRILVKLPYSFVKVLVGVLVRFTTCKRLTNNSLPKLSLITLAPSETAGYQVGRIFWRICQYPSGLISWGYRGEFFSSSTWGESEKSLWLWVVGFEPTTPKKRRGLSTTPFVKVLVGY